MAPTRKTILMHTAVWGDWHVDALVNITIPTLLAPGNLPHMAQHHGLGYLITTRPSDRARIEAAPAVQRLKQIVPIEIQANLPDIESNENVFNIHHAIWRGIEEQVKAAKAFMWNMPPDVAFADGAGVTLTNLLAQGKRSIMWWYARTVDTVVPLLQSYLRPDGVISIEPRRLVDLSFQHIHPLSKAYFVDNPCFAAFHPEMLQWRVSENAMLVRMLASANWLYEPGHFKLTHQHLLDGELDFNEVTVIDDSDDLFVASLAPLTHNADWYGKPTPADPVNIAYWWQNWHSPSNDFIAGHHIRMHGGGVPDEVWRRYEKTSDRFVSQISLRRQTFDVAKAALEARCTWAAALLTTLGELWARRLTTIFTEQANVIVFAPSDDATKQIPEGASQALMSARLPRLRRFVTSHVAVEDHTPGSLIQRLKDSGGTLRLRALSGAELLLTSDAAGHVFVNGIPAIAPMIVLHGHTVVPIAGVLDPAFMRELTLTVGLPPAVAAG